MKNIRIQSNLYLYLLTGRSRQFSNPSLNTDLVYSVKETPDDVVYARRFLGLSIPYNDFAVISILAASMMSKSMLRTMRSNSDAVFVPGLLRIPPIQCNAVLLGNTEHSWASIDGSVAGSAGFRSIAIRRVDSTTAQIQTDDGAVETSQTTVSILPGGMLRLSVENVKNYGVHASFGVEHWNDGDVIDLKLAPTRFPFVRTSQLIRQDRRMTRLMTAQGTLPTFASSAANPALQVGMAGLAIIRCMLQQLDDAQAGYEVVTMQGSDYREPLATVTDINLTTVNGIPAPVVASQPEIFDV